MDRSSIRGTPPTEPVGPHAAFASLIAILVIVPTILVISIRSEREFFFIDDVFGVQAVGLPATFALAAVALVLTGMSWLGNRERTSTIRVLSAAEAVAGVAVAYTASRVLFMIWGLWGGGTEFEREDYYRFAVAGVALVGGVMALVQGARNTGQESTSWSVVLGGLGVVSVPALPWLILLSDGDSSVIGFNHVASLASGLFPAGFEIALWLILWACVGLGLAGLAASLLEGADSRSEIDRAHLWASGVAGLLLLAGYVTYWITTGWFSGEIGDTLLPLFNYLPLLLGAWAVIRVVGRVANSQTTAHNREDPGKVQFQAPLAATRHPRDPQRGRPPV